MSKPTTAAAERLSRCVPPNCVHEGIYANMDEMAEDAVPVARAYLALDEQLQPKLSDDWRTEEPLAYLVKCFDTTMHEYKVFANEDEAQRFAESQEQLACDSDDAEDWLVYPLYASIPLASDASQS